MATLVTTDAPDQVRTAVRFPMRLSLMIHTGTGEMEATTENISANGILFTGPHLPAVDDRIEFTITMPANVMGTPEDLSIQCTGRVVRHQSHDGETQAAAIIDEYLLRV
ncbi:PilZ domain-containing protein [Granulicella tundricola]|uniref:Type IV pilus assembly PilZ n=1 Tax=Granulicella tundricola (strain ATCC BAA-1859 / DSM 23138 / MP5ACTX9) TaxID=1198114 RepID=E8X1Y8_GRATM|nr:PilZ domain-containing protein [Granulicella tundricola]ADW69149.1 type IV pilus assembly PilZ [Granulicella tundricola MP5ACTX9]